MPSILQEFTQLHTLYAAVFAALHCFVIHNINALYVYA